MIEMLRTISAILPCNCVPPSKQADKHSNIHQTACNGLTSEQPSPTRPPSITDQQEKYKQEQGQDQDLDQDQDQDQEPAPETGLLPPPSEDDPDSTLTLTAIEASIAPNNEDLCQDQIENKKHTKVDADSKRASAPPNVELNIACDPLPDFSLDSRARLSYWGPPPYLPPDLPLPDSPIRCCQPRKPHTNQSPFYGAYFRGEETLPRVLLSMRSNPRLATVLRRA